MFAISLLLFKVFVSTDVLFISLTPVLTVNVSEFIEPPVPTVVSDVEIITLPKSVYALDDPLITCVNSPPSSVNELVFVTLPPKLFAADVIVPELFVVPLIKALLSNIPAFITLPVIPPSFVIEPLAKTSTGAVINSLDVKSPYALTSTPPV